MIKETIVNSQNQHFGDLIWPKSIVSSLNDEILCADTYEHRILIFNRDFIFKYQIGGGERSDQKGKFNEPVDLTLTEMGLLYVADKNNCRLQVFRETKKYKQSKVYISRLLVNENEDNNDPNRPTKSRLSTGRISSFKVGSEFIYDDQVQLKEKPIKLSAAPLSSILAVSTENGHIFILNGINQIINFLKINEANRNNIRNFCLNDFGNELIIVSIKGEVTAHLKFYKIDSETNSLDALTPDSKEKKEAAELKGMESLIKKMEMVNKVKLDKTYFPGISLTKVGAIKLSLDLRHLLIYDSMNLCLLEYDMTGKFKKVILKSENHLGNLLAFDFSSDRQHIITTEVELLKRSVDLDEPTLIEMLESTNPLEKEYLSLMKKRSKKYVFKLKTFRYQDCMCHRHLNTGKRKPSARSKSPGSQKNKNIANATNNNQSSFSFYNGSIYNV